MPTLKQATTPPANLKNMTWMNPAAPNGSPSPAYSMPGYDPLTLSPAPAVLAQVPDLQRQFYRPGVNQFRTSPLPPKQNLSANAAIKSIATQVAAASPGTPPTLIVPKEFTPTQQTGNKLQLAWAAEPANYVFATPSATFGGFVDLAVSSHTGVPPVNLLVGAPTSGPNEWAFAFNFENNDVTPAGWTTLLGSGSANFTAWGQFFALAGSNPNYIANVESGEAAVSCMVLFGTSGVPVVNNFYAPTFSSPPFVFTSPTKAHDCIIVVATNTPGSGLDLPQGTITDSQGNTYERIIADGSNSFPAALNESMAVYAAFDIVGGANTLNWFLTTTTSIYVFVVSGIAAAPIIPRFISASDVLSGSSVTSLNALTGALVLQSSDSSVDITPSTPNIDLTVPVMVGDTGSGGVQGLVPAPAAGDAAADKFLKADGTWDVPAGGSGGVSSLNSLTGALNITSADASVTVTPSGTSIDLSVAGGSNVIGRKVVSTTTYNQISTDAGKVLDFQGVGGGTITLAGTGASTITAVQNKDSGAGSATFSITFTNPTTTGNTITVGARLTSGSGTPTVTDSQGNPYIHRVTNANGGTNNMWWDSIHIAGGSSCTVSIQTGLYSFCEMIIIEWSGISGFDTADATGATGSGATATSNAITPGVSNALIVGWTSNETANGLTITAGSGYTIEATANGNVSAESKLLASPTSTTASFGLSSSVAWFAGILSYAPITTGTLFSGWVQNNSSGGLVVATTTGLINGAASITLAANTGATIGTDNTDFTAVL